MSGGDTLTLADGTYTSGLSGVKSGSAGAYTIIKATNDGGAIITGGLQLEYTTSYIQVEGIKFNNASDKPIEGNHHKFLRCAFQGGGASGYGTGVAVGTNDNASSTNYILFEDCWFFGLGGRYNLQLYLVDHIVMRRCVFRHDGGYGPNSGNPEACLSVYNSQYVELQNCISIDSNLGTYVYYDQAFYFIYNSASAESTGPLFVRGSIVLNTAQNAYRSDTAGSSTMTFTTFTDSVGWGYEGYGFANGSSSLNLSIAITKSAFGNGLYGFGDWGPGSPSINNSIVKSISSTVYDGWSSSSMLTNPTTQWLYLPRIETGTAGPTILKRIGTSGTLYGETGYATTTNDDLWPWPNEARIKTDMASVSTRGFAAATSNPRTNTGIITLTSYIWEYLGNTVATAGLYAGSGDVTAPVVEITTIDGSANQSATYLTSSSTVTLAGTVYDAVGVVTNGVTWANSAGGSGTATCANCDGTAGTKDWSQSGITLQSGENIITIYGADAVPNTGTDVLTVTYETTPPTVTSASVNGATATINFSETVVTTGYDTGDFNLDCTSPTLTDVSLSSPSGSGSSRTFTIATPIVYGQTCNLDYVGTAGDITDSAGNNMVAINNISVTNNTPNPADLTPPVCIINNPTTNTTWPTSSATITVGGSATDNVGVTSISWACPTCTPASGVATCVGCTGQSVTWSQLVALTSGANVFTATATDGVNTHADAITITYTPGVGPAEHSTSDVRGVTLRGVKR
jgi:hypothetical protein